MQLKIRRSQRDGGMVTKSVIFCLDARAEFTAEERRNLERYKLHSQTIYNSEASKRLLDKADGQRDGSAMGGIKSLMSVAMAAMKLNITVSSLERGQHIECRSMDELLGAEDALMTACENLKVYLDTAATFDGREVVVDFSAGAPSIVAHATTPDPMLVLAPQLAPGPTADPPLLSPPQAPAASMVDDQPMRSYSDASDDEAAKPWNETPAFYAGCVFVMVLLLYIMLK